MEYNDSYQSVSTYDANVNALVEYIRSLDLEGKVKVLNEIRTALHGVSPFKAEPVDLTLWVKLEEVEANDYNPNSVAPPEMKLLQKSIEQDGYTQPIVTWMEDGHREVIDGYHRNRVGQEVKTVRERIKGYLPVVTANNARTGRNDRVASMIRHNRARGSHSIDLMSHIVSELVDSGMSDNWILRHIGMDKDELLRLKQVTGLASLFKDQEFSNAWNDEINK